jgi:hypothetical protein
MGKIKVVTLADGQDNYNHIIMSDTQETVCGLDIRRHKILKIVDNRLTCPICFNKTLKIKETAPS